jgi:protein AbiQ
MGNDEPIKLYSVTDDYINYLRVKFPRIYSNKEDERAHTRKYLGAIIKENGFNYYIPLSSPKDKDFIEVDGVRKIRPNSLIVIRITSMSGGVKELKGTLQIGTMIPVPDSELELYDVDAEPDLAYKDLVQTEIIYIRKNRHLISKYAHILYKKKMEGSTEKVVQNALDFKEVEKLCNEWKR